MCNYYVCIYIAYIYIIGAFMSQNKALERFGAFLKGRAFRVQGLER